MSLSSIVRRFPAREIIIGDRPLGGNNPIRLQSMTNTNTLDIGATVNQSIKIIEAGADYVRISAPSIEAANRLKEIKKGIRDAGFTNPLVADIHFKPEVALVAATITEKIRINPGNYTSGISKSKTSFTKAETQAHLEMIKTRLAPLVNVCRDHGTVIRIGTNMGSLSPRIVAKYGNTPQAMVQSTLEFLKIFRELEFHHLVISLKASKPLIMVQAYEEMVEKMIANNMDYPLHIGITEAGEGENGRIKSALGICTLLNKGIGDTLRVSLTENPELEIPFAKKLADPYQKHFVANDTPDTYQIIKTSIPDQVTTIFNDHRKAIVIATCRDKELQFHPVKENTGNSINKNNTLTGQRVDRKPDLWFCQNTNCASRNVNLKYILPEQEWVKNQMQNIYPLFTIDQLKEIRYSYNLGFFLDLSDDKLPDDLIFSYFIRPIAVINKPERIIQGRNDKTGSSEKPGIPVIAKKIFNENDPDELICSIARSFGPLLTSQHIQGIWVEAPNLKSEIDSIVFGFLQSSGLRITNTEFISCPTCARTSFDLQSVLKEVQERTSGIPGLKIAVMGCVVNGPGEMADADFGYVGAGNGKIHLYKGKTAVRKNILPGNAVNALVEILRENGYLADPTNEK
jgi:(E)-4-hydroxy-3-methylbut-2-enyl-diphosphate synthase